MSRFLWFQWGSEQPETMTLPYPERLPCPKCKASMRVDGLLPMPMVHVILVDYRCERCGFLETGIFERPAHPDHR